MDQDKSGFNWFYFAVIALVCIIGLDTYVLDFKIKHKLQRMLHHSQSGIRKTEPERRIPPNAPEIEGVENLQGESIPAENDESSREKTLVIHGLGSYSRENLEDIKKGVEEYYIIECVIGEPVETISSLYVEGKDILKATSVLSLAVGKKEMHMYVTDEPLINSDPDNLISGHSFVNNTKSVVSTYQSKKNGHYSVNSVVHTARHELGHNFGLDHCEDKNCLMVEKGLGTMLLCGRCKRNIEGKMKY